MTLTYEDIVALPKVVLHDHLDGGLRPATIIELAAEAGHDLPSNDPDELAAWFVQAASAGDLTRYLETFAHTLAVTQACAGWPGRPWWTSLPTASSTPSCATHPSSISVAG
jgi:adenosine deaminase